MSKRKKKELEEGKLPKLWPYLVQLQKEHPEAFDDPDTLRRTVSGPWAALKDPSSCPNCLRGMEIKVYKADLHNALFLLAMARAVGENMEKGMSFTEANRVHAPSLPVSNTVSKRITQCDYLGFVKQPDKLRRTGYWVITSWGWKALAGEPVPAAAKYWNGKLKERSSQTITLSEMFKVHRDLVMKAARMKKKVNDHTAEIGEYNPKDWAPFAGYEEGQLFES